MWHRLFMALLTLIFISAMGFQAFQPVSSSVGRNFGFRNCNSTEVPIYFKNMALQPDPMVILTEKWLFNMTFEILVTQLITRVEVIFSLTLQTDEGNTELCYLLGDRCYVADGCQYVNKTSGFTGIPCPLKEGTYPGHFQEYFNPLPFIVRGKYTVHMGLRSEGIPIGCLEFTVCFNDCDYNAV